MKNSFLRKLGALVKLVFIVVITIGIHPPVIGAEHIPPEIEERDEREILWLARAVFSETKDKEAQYLVAWTIRNRVDTGYRGFSYEDVVKSKNQYSGLQPRDAQYKLNISLDYEDADTAHQSWSSALSVASEVYFADDSARPFPITVRHFYSPKVVSEPSWASGKTPHLAMQNPSFAFYNNVK